MKNIVEKKICTKINITRFSRLKHYITNRFIILRNCSLKLELHRLCQIRDARLSLNYAPFYHPLRIYRLELSNRGNPSHLLKPNLFQWMNKSVDNIFLSTNAVKAHSRTHNARHSSAEKSEGIIAPMVPHKGRICTSPLRQDRREITPLCVTPFSPPWRPARRANASLHFAHPREAHTHRSHTIPPWPPSRQFLPTCMPWMRIPSPTNREED